MGGWRRDGALKQPGQRAEPGGAVEPLIPANGRMRADDHRDLHDAVDHIDPAESQKKQRARQPEAGHQRVVEGIVAIDQPHAHIACRMMRAMQRPHHRGVAQPMPPVLSQVVGQQQYQQHLPPGPVGERIALRRHQPVTQCAGRAQHAHRDQRKHQRDRNLQAHVFPGGFAGQESALQHLGQRERRPDRADHRNLESLRGHGVWSAWAVQPRASQRSVLRAASTTDFSAA